MAQIEHIIVLMMENRSFDHMLGYMQGPNCQIDGLSGDESNRDDTGEPVKVSSDAAYAGDFDPDPGHDFSDVQLQLYGTPAPPLGQEPDMSGFVRSYGKMCGDNVIASHRIMKCFHPSRLPVLTTLAQQFAICDRWFSSVPGPTLPNRLFAHCGTSAGRLDLSPDYFSGFTTIYEVLDKADVGATIYSPGWTAAATFPYLLKYQEQFFGTLDQFYQDCDEDELPPYCFLEPRYSSGFEGTSFFPQSDQHPDSDVFEGEKLIRRVYERIRENRKVWEKSVLVITYDEHGGLYDHVVPPKTDSPDGKPSQNPDFSFNRLGVRVPAVIVSPYITPGTISHDVYDFTSLLATAMDLFGVNREKLPAIPGQPAPNARVLQAKNFLKDCLNLAQPRQDKVVFPPMQGGLPAPAETSLNDLQLEYVTQAAYLDAVLPPQLSIRRIDATKIVDLTRQSKKQTVDYINQIFPTDRQADQYISRVFATVRAHPVYLTPPPSK